MAGAATAIIAGVGLVLSATGMAMNFTAASRARRAQADAEYDAQNAMRKAREKLNVNFYENLAINKEAYELEREALLSAGAQATAAGAESERGAAAVAGRVLAAQNQAQAQQRVAMSKEQKALDAMIAKEDSRLRDVKVQLDLEEVAGAQAAAGRAEQQAAQYQAAAVQGALDTAKAGLTFGDALGQAKAAKGGDFAEISSRFDSKEGIFRRNDAPGDLASNLQGFSQSEAGKKLGFGETDFTSTLEIADRPAINPDTNQSQLTGQAAMQEALLKQLGPQGLKAFEKYLRQQARGVMDGEDIVDQSTSLGAVGFTDGMFA